MGRMIANNPLNNPLYTAPFTPRRPVPPMLKIRFPSVYKGSGEEPAPSDEALLTKPTSTGKKRKRKAEEGAEVIINNKKNKRNNKASKTGLGTTATTTQLLGKKKKKKLKIDA